MIWRLATDIAVFDYVSDHLVKIICTIAWNINSGRDNRKAKLLHGIKAKGDVIPAGEKFCEILRELPGTR